MNLLRTEQERLAESRRTGDLARARARAAEELVSSLQQQHRVALRVNKQNESEVNSLKQQAMTFPFEMHLFYAYVHVTIMIFLFQIAQHQVECQNRQTQQDQEQSKLKELAKSLEKKLKIQDAEYNQQIDQLRASYQKSVGYEPQAESVRQRYQKEIEQLRALCEKGLLAMENSHRRVIQELEEKHKLEREQLRYVFLATKYKEFELHCILNFYYCRVDKEQALAEETQATLAALDAMRKAHENEVQREVTKFKKEFTSRTLQNHDTGQMHSRHQYVSCFISQVFFSSCICKKMCIKVYFHNIGKKWKE